MRIVEWGAENLFGYRGLKVNLSSLGSTILLDGINKDFASRSSNGAGKSSVIETVPWVLHGQTIRGLEKRHGKDAVIFDKAEGGALGYIKIALENKELEIQRYRGHEKYNNEIRILVDGKDRTKRTAKLTQQSINKYLGFDFDLFNRSIVLHSWATESFRTLNDRYLKHISEQLIGMPSLECLLETTGKYMTKYANIITSLNFEIASLRREIDSEEKMLVELEKSERTYIATRKRELDSEIANARIAISIARKRRKKCKATKDRIGRGSPVSEHLVTKLECKLQDAAHTNSNTERELVECEVEERTIRDLLRKYQKIKGVATCPECRQKISVAHVKKHTDKYAKELQLCVEKRRAIVKKRDGELADIGSLGSRIDDLMRKEKVANLAVSTADLTIKALTKEIDTAKSNIVKFESELTNIVNPYIDLIKKSKAKIDKAAVSVKEKIEWLNKHSKQKKYYDFWKRGFGPSGMRAFLIDNITPELNRLANIYLGELTDDTVGVTLSTLTENKDGSYSEKFSVSINNSIGSKHLAASSDGEIGCVDIAINLAMADMLESRIPGGLGLLYIDQAIDLVDAVRGQKALALLSKKTDKKWCKEIGILPKEHIFVVTHRQEFKGMFQSTLFAEKENGVCSLREI